MHHEPCSVWPACTTTYTRGDGGGGGGGVPWLNQDFNWYIYALVVVPWQKKKTPNVLEQLLKTSQIYCSDNGKRKSGLLSPN
jgi:hypothetical protein